MELQDVLDKIKTRRVGDNIKNLLTESEFEFLKKEIIKMNELGLSFIKISSRLGIYRHTIRRWMKSVDYKIVNTHNRLRVREDLFNTIETEEDAYWLGFLHADGYISKGGMIQVGLKHTDYKHLLKFADFCGFDKSKVVRKQKTNFPNSYRCRMSFSTQHLKENFTKHGVFNNKSLTLVFPEWLPKDLHPHFIRGYFDGDGTITIVPRLRVEDFKQVSLIGTKEFLESVLRILNLDLKLYKDKRHRFNTYSIQFNKKDGLNFLDYMYKNSNIYLERKNNLYLQGYSPSV